MFKIQSVIVTLLFLFALPLTVQAATACECDIDQSGLVDLTDYSILVSKFFQTNAGRSDIDRSGLVDLTDYSLLVANFFRECTVTTTSSTTSQPSSQKEWSQDAGNAQRTGYIAEFPSEPWTLAWTWNGPDANGGSANHFYDAPPEARTVAGGAHIYAPGGAAGVFGVRKSDGKQAWNNKATSFNAAGAYEPLSGSLYIGGANGLVYKLNATTGATVATYNAGSSINKAVLLVGDYVYAVTDSGELHKVRTSTMQLAWKYSANAAIATPPSFAATKQLIIYATNDLYVHAVSEASGTAKWRVKPTPNPAGFPNEFDGYYPVVAEKEGVVFVRMRLHHDALWSGPGPSNKYPTTNAETRSFLISRPQLKNLFALNLDDGSEKFIPAVGYGGVEDIVNNQPFLDVGPVPVIKQLASGQEIAYQLFRNGQGNRPDGRWDTHLGEMVLSSQTISGLAAGDLRFINTYDQSLRVTDEQTPLTMAGDTIFYAHWGATEIYTLLDRSSSRGLTYDSPITTKRNPVIIRRMQSCSNFNPVTHWTTCGLALYQDGRYWQGPGWWVYWNVMDPPTPVAGAYSEGIQARYAYVSDGLIIVQGNGGDLFVLKHSGTKL